MNPFKFFALGMALCCLGLLILLSGSYWLYGTVFLICGLGLMLASEVTNEER